jgi:hypothetical protein
MPTFTFDYGIKGLVLSDTTPYYCLGVVDAKDNSSHYFNDNTQSNTDIKMYFPGGGLAVALTYSANANSPQTLLIRNSLNQTLGPYQIGYKPSTTIVPYPNSSSIDYSVSSSVSGSGQAIISFSVTDFSSYISISSINGGVPNTNTGTGTGTNTYNSDLSTGAIVGIIFGCLIAVGLFALGIYYYFTRRIKNHGRNEEENSTEETPETIVQKQPLTQEHNPFHF